MPRALQLFGALAASLVVLAVPLACGVDPAVTKIECPPSDPVNFGPVSAVLEFRCGTLDCHGNSFRPLRIYGKNGLRRPEVLNEEAPPVFPPPGSEGEGGGGTGGGGGAGGGGTSEPTERPEGLNAADFAQYYPGGLATTPMELEDNARSLCGLEPELVKAFRDAVKDDPTKVGDLANMLTIFRKARLVERHKGGQIWDKGDDPDECLQNWMKADRETGVDPAPCRDAL